MTGIAPGWIRWSMVLVLRSTRADRTDARSRRLASLSTPHLHLEVDVREPRPHVLVHLTEKRKQRREADPGGHRGDGIAPMDPDPDEVDDPDANALSAL